jgi:hypothetical protein
MFASEKADQKMRYAPTGISTMLQHAAAACSYARCLTADSK